MAKKVQKIDPIVKPKRVRVRPSTKPVEDKTNEACDCPTTHFLGFRLPNPLPPLDEVGERRDALRTEIKTLEYLLERRKLQLANVQNVLEYQTRQTCNKVHDRYPTC